IDRRARVVPRAGEAPEARGLVDEVVELEVQLRGEAPGDVARQFLALAPDQPLHPRAFGVGRLARRPLERKSLQREPQAEDLLEVVAGGARGDRSPGAAPEP